MAQWLGQFSGHTHETRVEDAEASLRHAIEACRAGDGNSVEAGKKARSIIQLAERLQRARSKLWKARLSAAIEGSAGSTRVERDKRIETVRRKYEVVRDASVPDILSEFGAQHVPILAQKKEVS